jgi:Tfp pilus assembly protein PilF
MRLVLLVLLMSILFGGCAANMQQSRDEAVEHYRLARSYLGNGSYLLAEEEIKKALDLVSDDPQYYELLALIYQFRGRLQLADEAYSLALRQAEVPPSVLVNYLRKALCIRRRALYSRPWSSFTLL